MKKKVSLLMFLAIGTVVLMASYRSTEKQAEPISFLTAHAWKFEKAESLNTNCKFVAGHFYNNAQYNFTPVHTYQGEFFEKPIQGTWQLTENQELILNEGTVKEEHLEIVELNEEILRVRVMEKGASVVITFR